ncbi:peptidoglycan-binding domain-containing protein [Protofrankia symbiont of Coriaria ruscifolia]|uniref:Peptidoglycan-binding domain 1 protein n=1 Tax=Candidatus Protofrankia californiensis TaxID=1839754 RepID=A0A1C3NUY1_9ACTN|nr:peptidoglycan-binding protein [Protofrankia symbiont of Coriaria ruscifolia]SBW19191.1 peptidoglycan-binding domain 1 protein [Candidatus Protofrankia californiensis]
MSSLTWPLQKNGSSREPVQTVQYLLRAHGYSVAIDGLFGASTEAAVRAFQSSAGLGADGAVGDQTWPALVIVIREGDRSEKGDAVRAVQDQANARIGDPANFLPVDGVFGRRTDAWVRDFQRNAGITADGIVGPVTWNHLVKDEPNI